MKTCALFGHRKIQNITLVKEKLKAVLKNQIQDGFDEFLIGNYGDFDRLALSVLKELKIEYKNININLIITNLYCLKNIYQDNLYNVFMYEIEDFYPKARIFKANCLMVENSNLIICYLNFRIDNSSNTKKIVDYAIKNKKKVINIF